MKRSIYYPISGLRRDHYVVLFPIGSIRLRSGEIIQPPRFQGSARQSARVIHRAEKTAPQLADAAGALPRERLPRIPFQTPVNSGPGPRKPLQIRDLVLQGLRIFGVHKRDAHDIKGTVPSK